jgi:hypothetical protein
MTPRGPLGYDLRSDRRGEGSRSAGQYLDLDFYIILCDRGREGGRETMRGEVWMA